MTIINSEAPPVSADQRGDSARPTAIDLFCGAGGLSYGLEQAGFDVRLGLDFDKHALETYKANHSGQAMLADVTKVTGQQLLDAAGLTEVDLLAGGPSCQGFSTHGKRIADDPRNFLYVEFLRLVDEIRPATVLIENVRGLLSTGKGAYKREIFDSFHSMGYSIDAKVLSATDFGVPQRRQRVFFVASRLSEAIALPSPTHAAPDSDEVRSGRLLPFVNLGDAILDLPTAHSAKTDIPLELLPVAETEYATKMRSGARVVWNHVAKPLSDLALGVVKHLHPGEGLRSLSPELLPERFQKMRRIANGNLRSDCTTLYHRLSMEQPAYTITCNFRNVSSGAFTHPTENRSLTPREAARIQSFPDTFKFYGSSVPRQIGNAVPPLLARAVGSQIVKSLERHRAAQSK